MKQNTLFWKGHVRKISGSFYVALPQDYIKSNEIVRDDVVIFRLARNGINMTFRKPVKPSEEWTVDQ